MPAPERRDSGYRDYGEEDVHRLGFVRRARDLGFSIEQIRSLLALWSDTGRSNADVRAIARAHLKEMEDQARKLQDMTGWRATRAFDDIIDDLIHAETH